MVESHHFTVNAPPANQTKAGYDEVLPESRRMRLRRAIPAPEYHQKWYGPSRGDFNVFP
jgi:hypothetical protein